MARQDQYSFPRGPVDADIQVVIVGNPKGVYSSHHEKLVLIDGECPDHALAFVGGFDMARGRYDQPAHVPPPAAAASVLSQSWLRRCASVLCCIALFVVVDAAVAVVCLLLLLLLLLLFCLLL